MMQVCDSVIAFFSDTLTALFPLYCYLFLGSASVHKSLIVLVSSKCFLFSSVEAAHAGQLRICRVSESSSSVLGGKEVFLLCDKVQKGT